MTMMKKVAAGAAVVCMLAGAVTAVHARGEHAEKLSADMTQYSDLQNVIKDVAIAPKIAQPTWLKEQITAEQQAAAQSYSTSAQKYVTYTIETRGVVRSSLSEFRTLVQQTLTDTRGWAGLGISFREVASGGSFTLILAQAEEVGKASSGCSSEWSCRVGTNVYINDDRWSSATTAWNNAGGSLRDYRHYVVNHEVGHWLGHGHYNCSGAGQLAPVMLQQSIDLQGCKFNAWPLPHERSAPNLGI